MERKPHVKAKPTIGKRKWYRTMWTPPVTASVITAILTLGTTVTGGIILGYFKGELFKKPPTRAAFEKPTIETNVTLKDYSDERQLTDAYTPDKLAQVGYVVHFKVQIEGFKQRTCIVRWEVFDAKNRSRIVPPGWQRIQEPLELIPERDSDSAAGYFWVPPTNTEKPFFITVRLYDDKGTELDYTETLPVKPNATAVASSPTPSTDSRPVKPCPRTRKMNLAWLHRRSKRLF